LVSQLQGLFLAQWLYTVFILLPTFTIEGLDLQIRLDPQNFLIISTTTRVVVDPGPFAEASKLSQVQQTPVTHQIAKATFLRRWILLRKLAYTVTAQSVLGSYSFASS
jgi:hypothetical protein